MPPTFAYVAGLAVICWLSGAFAAAFWLLIATSVIVGLTILLPNIWPEREIGLLEGYYKPTIKQALIQTSVVLVIFIAAWNLGNLTGSYFE
jgi:hypothetical protein